MKTLAPSTVLFIIFPESVASHEERAQKFSFCIPAGATVALICTDIQSGRWWLFLISFPVLLDKELRYSVFLQFVPEHLLSLSPCVFLPIQKRDCGGTCHFHSETIILLAHLPASPAQTYRAVRELFPSYPVTLLRILSFFVGQRAFVEEKIIGWVSVAAVWLLSCDNERLWNWGVSSVADQHWPVLLQLVAQPCFWLQQLCVKCDALLHGLGPHVESSQPVCAFLILFIPHLHRVSELKK